MNHFKKNIYIKVYINYLNKYLKLKYIYNQTMINILKNLKKTLKNASRNNNNSSRSMWKSNRMAFLGFSLTRACISWNIIR